MVKTKRAKKKLHKAELKAKIVKFEQTTLRLFDELDSNKPVEAQLQEIRQILEPYLSDIALIKKKVENLPQATHVVVEPVVVEPVAEKSIAKPKFEATFEPTTAETPAKEEAGTNAPLRLDVATTLYTYLCNQAEVKDCTYAEVLIEKLQEFQAGTQELDTNDFSACYTNQRIYIHLNDSLRGMIDGYAKKLKLPKRAVVETICSTLIRKG